MFRKLLLFIAFLSFSNFISSQCNDFADFGTDTINGCDSSSIQINYIPVVNGSYVFTTSNNEVFSGI